MCFSDSISFLDKLIVPCFCLCLRGGERFSPSLCLLSSSSLGKDLREIFDLYLYLFLQFIPKEEVWWVWSWLVMSCWVIVLKSRNEVSYFFYSMPGLFRVLPVQLPYEELTKLEKIDNKHNFSGQQRDPPSFLGSSLASSPWVHKSDRSSF